MQFRIPRLAAMKHRKWEGVLGMVRLGVELVLRVSGAMINSKLWGLIKIIAKIEDEGPSAVGAREGIADWIALVIEPGKGNGSADIADIADIATTVIVTVVIGVIVTGRDRHRETGTIGDGDRVRVRGVETGEGMTMITDGIDTGTAVTARIEKETQITIAGVNRASKMAIQIPCMELDVYGL